MKKEIALVCCYFNPCNYVSKYYNFLNFYRGVCNLHGLDVYVIESYNNNSKFRISDNIENCTTVFCEHTYWQKEQLLNILINTHKHNYEYIGWVDGDIEIKTPGWVHNLKTATEEHGVAQICRHIEKETNFKKDTDTTMSMTHYMNQTNSYDDILHNRTGEPGYGFLYKSELFLGNETPLYEKAICGSGDFLNLIGYVDHPNIEDYLNHDRFFIKLNKLKTDFLNWKHSKRNVDKIPCAENTLRVSYHGTHINRKYVERETILRTNNYDPDADLEITDSGMYNIKSSGLKNSLENYFRNRREDDFFSSSINTHHFKKQVASLIRHYDPGFNSAEDPFSFLNKIKTGVKPTKSKLSNRVDCVCVKNYKKNHKFGRLLDAPTIINNTDTTNPRSYVENYLKYIIDNYDSFGRIVCFINEELPHNKSRLKRDIYDFKNIQTKTPIQRISEGERDIILTRSLHIKSDNKIKYSKYNLLQWFSIYMGTCPFKFQKVNDYHKIIDVSTNYYIQNSSGSFLVKGESILKNKKEKYEKLYTHLTQTKSDEEIIYFKHTFQYLFT